MKAFAVIPIFRQGEIGQVLARFSPDLVARVIVVSDDASADDQRELLALAEKTPTPVQFVFRSGRQGVGSAILDGLRAGEASGHDVAVVMAGNGKDDPREIPRLLDAIRDGADYVQGSRYLPGGVSANLPWYRKVTNRIYPILWKAITDYPATEVTNGFRAYRLSILNKPGVDVDQDWLRGYSFEYYLHFKALTLGLDVREVPVSKLYKPGKGYKSKINPFKDWWDIGRPFVLLTLGVRR